MPPGWLCSASASGTHERAPQRVVRRILPRLADSRPLFHLAPRWWGPWVFQGTHGVCETLPDGRLREIVKIHPEHEACPEFFSGLTGTLLATAITWQTLVFGGISSADSIQWVPDLEVARATATVQNKL